MGLPRKTSLAILAFIALGAVPELTPKLSNYRIIGWSRIAGVLDFKPRNFAISDAQQAQNTRDPLGHDTAVFPLDDAAGGLDSFYDALWRAEMKRRASAITVLHYGDSPTTADLITADLRGLLQSQFGDAGHGFVLIGKPWAWYGHRGIDISSSGWQITAANNQTEVRDGMFGLGGVTFRGGPGAESKLVLRDQGYTAIEVSYLLHPAGGQFAVFANGARVGEAKTWHATVQSGYASFPLPAGTKRVEIRVEQGSPRLFGAQLLKPGPGVVYHSLGLNGAYVSVLSRMFRDEHW